MVFEKTVAEVINENFVYARALHFLGIDFFENQDAKLGSVCAAHKIDEKRLIRSFYSFDTQPRISFKELEQYPIDLLLAYLHHAHYIFIKDKLPYIVYLCNKLNPTSELQILMPELVEELIAHIYEEEDTTFAYVRLLVDIDKSNVQAPFSQLARYHKFSLAEEYAHHQGEDELKLIKSLFPSIDTKQMSGKLLEQEIQAFDREMIYHAEIENSIFYPKALELETCVMQRIEILSQLN